MAHGVRDLDAMTARPPLPPRALPDDIRIKLKLAPRPADQVPIRRAATPSLHARGRTRALAHALERTGTLTHRQVASDFAPVARSTYAARADSAASVSASRCRCAATRALHISHACT